MTSPIEKLLTKFSDLTLKEICCNGPDITLLVNEDNTQTQVEGSFSSQVEMTNAVQDIAFSQRLRLDPKLPFAGGMLNGEIRWQAIIAPATVSGPLLYLRKHRFDFYRDRNNQEVSSQILEKLNETPVFLVAGKTGAGKTTLLHSLLSQTSSHKRVGVIEDTLELPLTSSNWIRLLAQKPSLEDDSVVSLEDCLRNALRIGVQHFVLGEIRGNEAKTFINMALSGHPSWATIHASTTNPKSVIARLDQLAGSDVVDSLLDSQPILVSLVDQFRSTYWKVSGRERPLKLG